MDAMQRACASDEVREMIEFRLKALRDEATRMERAEQKGRAEGWVEGWAEGWAEGKAEVARKLLAQVYLFGD